MKDQWWDKHLHNADFRVTAPREIIITILKETDKHLSAEDIYVAALKINPSVGLTTVYRTLDLLQQIGLLQKFEFGDRKARYELINNPKKRQHHHLVCMHCNAVIDYDDFINEESKLMEKTKKELSHKYHFKIMHHTVHFYGLCEKCQELMYGN